MNRGMKLFELIIFICLIVIIGITIYGLIKYGGKPVTDMPIWMYWLIGKK